MLWKIAMRKKIMNRNNEMNVESRVIQWKVQNFDGIKGVEEKSER